MALLNLEQQLSFYGAYHSNPINVAVHMVFVPLILLTTMYMLDGSGQHLALGPVLLHPSTLVSLVWGAGAVVMEPLAGSVYASALLMTCGLGRTQLFPRFGVAQSVKACAVLNVLAWIAQFLGHGVAERRKPALLDNLFQSVYLAPFFVCMEAFFALGYRPDLKVRLHKMSMRRKEQILAEENAAKGKHK